MYAQRETAARIYLVAIGVDDKSFSPVAIGPLSARIYTSFKIDVFCRDFSHHAIARQSIVL